MDISSSSSNDDLSTITEVLPFEDSDTALFPVIVNNETIALAETMTFEDGTQATVVSDVLTADYHTIALENKEDLEDNDVNLMLNVIEEPLSVYEALQMDGGTLAYIHSQPIEGSQIVELENGTIAYITLKKPVKKDRSTTEPRAMKQKAFVCPQDNCDRLFTSAHHLKVHERTHTGSRPYQCTDEGCSKAFATEYSRKAHIRTHTGEKPYKCPESDCFKGFKTSGDLQKHIRTHTGERPFACPVEGCDRSFTTSNIRKVHIRTHTGERPYVCKRCEKSFASATNYKNHIRIHSGERPYSCSVEGCNKNFTEYSSLYKHHMVHTQEKPYQCGICGRSYRQASTLTVHKRTSHGVIEADCTNTETTKLSSEGEYLGVVGTVSPEQVFIIDHVPEHLRALEQIIHQEGEELQAALDPLQEPLEIVS